jgi:hypothetical protein
LQLIDPDPMAWRALIKSAGRSARGPLSVAVSSAAAAPAGASVLRSSAAVAVAVASPWQSSVRHFAKAAKKGKGGGGNAAAAAAPADADAEAGAQATLDKAKKNMTGAVLNFTRALAQMRPGKADAGLFDELRVPAYGQHVALAQLAQVSVSGPHSLSVAVYDPSLVQDVRKAVEAMNPIFSIREDAGALDISFPK